jgi:phosphatidylinositol glycan class N
MAALGRVGFLLTAVIFHLVYILSIFDIYFVSPVVSGMQLFGVDRPPPAKPPADRLVLIVGDGLRADKAFQSFPEPYPKSDDDLVPRPLAPFLRSIVQSRATFGVSHTRVPTESRPGHVALIAGLYEDVSAVATGWKLNPVNFDSVFNRSRHTYSWGSPDILPMFEQGAVPGRVDSYMYEAEEEDFSKDATHLDYWVFDHVKDFLQKATGDQVLNDALRQDKVVFFLHLLGLDTTGHSYRPYSAEYLYNLKIVDDGVREITSLIEDFFADDRTAFVFTADHGMSDWGMHGDGHPDNTRTPLVAWGSGVAKPELYPDSVAPGHNDYSSDWHLDHVRRHDVAQADVAALMAHLIGTEFPGNSVGKLPLSYLAASPREKAEALLVNARGILEQYRVKEEKKRATQLRFQPYEPLSEHVMSASRRIGNVQRLIEAGKYEEAIEETDSLIAIALQGLRYLQTYDWLFLRTLITLGYVGWMAFAITMVVDMFVIDERIPPRRRYTGVLGFTSVLAALYASFVNSQSPPMYYAYAFFPVVFWEEVFAHRASLSQGRSVLFRHLTSTNALLQFFFHVVQYIAVILSLAFGYIHREILSVIFVVGAGWPLIYGFSFVQSFPFLSFGWAASCLVMSVFTLLPAMKTENIMLLLIGGFLMALLGILYLILEDLVLADFSRQNIRAVDKRNHSFGRSLMGAQVGLILLSMVVTRSSALSLQSKQGLPAGNQIVGWLILVISFLMPLAYKFDNRTHYMHRLMVLFLTCAPTFVILTISYEGLFYVAFSLTLMMWVRLESTVQNFTAAKTASQESDSADSRRNAGTLRRLSLSDARVALFFIIFLQSGFFSTGNVASVASFSLESVSRLKPVFDPFSQGALLILKILIPFALISANLGIVNKSIGVAPSGIFMLTVGLTDILTLYFFWVVKDEGSWLEIGSTISHFVIASLLCVFVAGLEGVSNLFISGTTMKETPPATAVNGSKENKAH